MRRNIIDRMALLCTLHADGPKTLRLLREAGCTDLDKLGTLGPDRLAKLLCLTPASARRFMREAGLLRERLDPTLEREEVMYPPTANAQAVKPPPPGSVRIAEPARPAAVAPEEAAPEPKSREGLDLRDRVLLDKVINRWRSDDDSCELQEDEPIVLVPTPQRAVASTEEGAPPGIGVGDLAGLDEEACAMLRAGGVHSLEDLATCPIDEITRRSGLSFTRARTLQFLAGRALARQPEASLESGSGLVAPRRAPEPARGAPKAEPQAEVFEKLSLAAPHHLLLASERFSVPLDDDSFGEGVFGEDFFGGGSFDGAEEGAGGPFA